MIKHTLTEKLLNGLYAQLHYFLNLSQLLVSCLPLLAKLINSGVLDLSSHGNNNQTHLNLANNGRQETRSWLKFRK